MPTAAAPTTRPATDAAELLEALWAADDRRAAARAGSEEHWQAMLEIARIEALLARSGGPPDPSTAGTPTEGRIAYEPILPRSARCRLPGCGGPRLAAPDGLPASAYCAAHILERTSAPER